MAQRGENETRERRPIAEEGYTVIETTESPESKPAGGAAGEV